MTRQEKSSGWKVGTISWKRVGVTVLAIAGAGLIAGLVSVHRAGIPHRPGPVHWEDPSAIQVSLAGAVYDATGNPEPGGQVIRAGWYGKGGLVTEAQAVADASGGYHFPNLRGYDPSHPLRQRHALVEWRYCLFALAPGQGFGYVELEPTHDMADADLRLSPEHRVSGTVTDVTGDPIEGATIFLREIEILDATGRPQKLSFYGSMIDRCPTLLFVKSDARGEFVLSGLPSGKGITLDVSAPRYLGEYPQNVSAEEPVSIALQRALRLAVKVVPEGSKVRLDPGAKLDIRRSEGGRRRAVHVSSDGWFHAVLATGHYEITLDSTEFEADPVQIHLTLESSGRPVIIHARGIPREEA